MLTRLKDKVTGQHWVKPLRLTTPSNLRKIQLVTMMQVSKAKKKSLRTTAVGNALYANEFREMMPVFKEVSLELALMSQRLFEVVGCHDPQFETCDDVRKARDEVANRMIELMKLWKSA